MDAKTHYEQMAREATLLREVADLKRELARLTGDSLISACGLDNLRLPLGDSTAVVEYDLDGDPISALVNGRMVGLEVFSSDILEDWRNMIKNHIMQSLYEGDR